MALANALVARIGEKTRRKVDCRLRLAGEMMEAAEVAVRDEKNARKLHRMAEANQGLRTFQILRNNAARARAH